MHRFRSGGGDCVLVKASRRPALVSFVSIRMDRGDKSGLNAVAAWTDKVAAGTPKAHRPQLIWGNERLFPQGTGSGHCRLRCGLPLLHRPWSPFGQRGKTHGLRQSGPEPSRSCDGLSLVRQLNAVEDFAGLLMSLKTDMTGQRQLFLCFSAGVLLRRMLLVITLGFLASFVLSGEAQAHGMHAGAIVANAADTLDDSTAKASTKCETFCCSLSGCASAFVTTSQTSLGFDSRSERFVRPADARAARFSQTSLRRPPRA